MRQGEVVEAESALQRALANPTDSWVAAHRRDLNAALTEAARQLGTVIVEGAPDGAVVRIGGREVGVAPLAPTRVRTGQVVVEAGALRVTVNVDAGATATALLGAPDGSTPGAASVSPAPVGSTQVEGYEPPSEPVGGPAEHNAPFPMVGSGAEIPASFIAPPTAHRGDEQRSQWTDQFRLNIGAIGGGGVSYLRGDTYVYAGLAATMVYGFSLQSEFTTRVDLVALPAIEGGLDRSFIDFVITPGVRWRPSPTTPFYTAFGARVGVNAPMAQPDVCDGCYGTTPVSIFFGAEVGVGTTFGSEAGWDLGLRVAIDNVHLSAFLTLDRRLL